MKGLRIAMFIVGVLIVLAGLSMLLVTRLEAMRAAGEAVGPANWVALIDALGRFWSQIIAGVGKEYGAGLLVLAIGVLVMVLPIALPTRKLA
ncbi:MAG: hypothetical protein GXY76_12380 [Chloroflexi bacterium]|nr:hypothetical protein [Chloroflexota bacterium]